MINITSNLFIIVEYQLINNKIKYKQENYHKFIKNIEKIEYHEIQYLYLHFMS